MCGTWPPMALFCTGLMAIAFVAVVVLASTASSDGERASNNAAHQQQDTIADLAASASNNYEQQQQQHGGSKAKKIQIVYIKVPLAKLRPSLAGSNGDHSANNAHQALSGSNYSTSAKVEQQYETSE